MALRKPSALNTLCADVLAEAQQPAGTWCLATHSRINESLRQSDGTGVEYFMSEIINRILSRESVEVERFKLAQLCTTAKRKEYPQIRQILIRYKNDLVQTANQIQSSPLGLAAAQLIWSLFEDREPRRGVGAGLRRVTAE
jgi:hypothetical protein